MAMSDPLIAATKEMDARFQRLTGREALGYIAEPMRNQWRIAFGDGTVCTSPTEARNYMATLLALAESNPGELPYPFDQELTPEQDLRVLNGWGEPSREQRVQGAMQAVREWRENPPKEGWE